ncbi:MAG: XrtA/PEP-CTERM system TPR-repeat protein PrsT [Gammaproteobacteria bacterium]
MAGSKSAILALLVLSLLACSDWFMDEQQLMQKAADYLANRNSNAAVIELKNVLQANPDNARARYLLAGINLDYGDYEAAAKEFRRAESAGWNREETRLGVARALLGMGLYSELRDATQPEDSWTATGRANLLALQAVAEAGLDNPDRASLLVEQATQLAPTALQVQKVRIQLHILSEQLAEVRDILNSAVESYPDDQELLLLDGSLYQYTGDVNAAADSYQRVMDIDPPGFISVYGRNARLQLAELQIMAGKNPLAEATLKPLYGRDPNDPIVNYLRGVLAFERGDYEKSGELLLKVLKLAPEHNPTRLLFGTVSFARQNFEQAAYFLSKYLAAEPENIAARKLLARSKILLGQHEEAGVILQSAITEDSQDAELLALAGLSELGRGEKQAGIAGLQKALSVSPDSVDIRTELARAYLDSGDSGLAISELRSILTAGGERRQTQALLVLAHLGAGELSEAISLVLTMVEDDPQDQVRLTLAGNVFAASGDRAEARRYLQRALASKPEFQPALLSLANLEELEGNYQAASDIYLKLVDQREASALPMLALARVAEAQGDIEAMVDWLKRAADHAPDDVKPRLYLAEYYLRNSNILMAQSHANAALKIAPRQPEVLLLQARLLMAGKDYRAAITPLSDLVAMQPGLANARVLLGECYLELGRVAEAREQLELALDGSPDNVPAQSLLVQLEIAGGAIDRALELCQRIQQQRPEFYLGYELAGDAYMAKGDFETADREYARARDRQESVELVIKQADNASRQGKHAVAVGYLQDWLSGHPDDVQAMQYLGITWQNTEQTELAISQYERVLAIDPDNTVALNNLAGLYQQAGKAEALGLAKRVWQLAPDNPGVMDTYGWLLVQQGSLQEGRQILERAVKLLPDNAEVRYHHAVAVYRSGDLEAGRQLLRTLLGEVTSFPGRDEAERLLAKEK